MRTPDPDLEEDYDDEERDTLTDVPGGVRLQKVLAEAGLGSRRHCEELIGAGSRSMGRPYAGSAPGSTPTTK